MPRADKWIKREIFGLHNEKRITAVLPKRTVWPF